MPKLNMEGSNDMDAAQIGATWDALWEKIENNGYGGITYVYREANMDFTNGAADGFSAEKTGTLTKNMIKGTDSLFSTATALKNVRSVNFHLNHDDIIVVNGLSYAGDANIPIPANQYLNENITFYYYDADCVTGINTMVATISRVERYIDLNDDGVLNGSINPATGEFIPGDDEIAYVEGADWEETNQYATYYVLPSVTDDFYSISQMAPRLDEDGNPHQILLKVYYTMLPRSLVVPEGSSEADTAEVIPAIVTAITDSATKNTMTEQQRGYPSAACDHADQYENRAHRYRNGADRRRKLQPERAVLRCQPERHRGH